MISSTNTVLFLCRYLFDSPEKERRWSGGRVICDQGSLMQRLPGLILILLANLNVGLHGKVLEYAEVTISCHVCCWECQQSAHEHQNCTREGRWPCLSNQDTQWVREKPAEARKSWVLPTMCYFHTYRLSMVADHVTPFMGAIKKNPDGCDHFPQDNEHKQFEDNSEAEASPDIRPVDQVQSTTPQPLDSNKLLLTPWCQITQQTLRGYVK